jgi:hypothetical protein
MEVSDTIGDDEKIGRGVSSEKSAKVARRPRSRVPYHEFLPREGVDRMSVDRLTLAGLDEATKIADLRDSERGRKCYGWAVLTAEDINRNGCEVVGSCQEDNPYHADIILPTEIAIDRKEQKKYAQKLADSSHWTERAGSE